MNFLTLLYKLMIVLIKKTSLNMDIFSMKDSDERSVAIAVRIHKTLELADDKYYMITCGRAGFQNLQNKTSLVTLQLLREGKKVEQVVYGREYMLRLVTFLSRQQISQLSFVELTSLTTTAVSG